MASTTGDDDDDGVGPLLLAACKRENMSLLKKLIEEHGDALNPNPIDGLGNGPLHYAAMGDHLEIASLLATRYPSSLNFDAQNFAGDTALHKAVEKNHLEFVEFLLEHGAQTTLKNKKGRDPSSMAIDPEAREMLRSAQLAKQVGKKQPQNPTETTTNTTATAPTVPSGPLPVVKAELDPSMIADEGDADDDEE